MKFDSPSFFLRWCCAAPHESSSFIPLVFLLFPAPIRRSLWLVFFRYAHSSDENSSSSFLSLWMNWFFLLACYHACAFRFSLTWASLKHSTQEATMCAPSFLFLFFSHLSACTSVSPSDIHTISSQKSSQAPHFHCPSWPGLPVPTPTAFAQHLPLPQPLSPWQTIIWVDGKNYCILKNISWSWTINLDTREDQFFI